MIGVDKMGEFVQHYVFYALDRGVDEGAIKCEDIFFVIAASPARFHVSEFQSWEVGNISGEVWIHFAAYFLDCRLQKRFEG